MPDGEKVVSKLQILRTWCAVNPDYDTGLSAEDCVKAVGWLDDAIALLKAQEPRVMTMKEVLATEVVYAEDIDKAEIIPVLVSRRAHDRIVLVRAHLMGGPSHVIYPLICEYGKRWRCWTSRPTDEQREKEPWNG
jgi:hypothetical protein